MPRPNRIGLRGLYRDPDGRYRIDLRWRDPKSGRVHRHQEQLPEGIPAAAAKRRAQEVLGAALGGTFQRRRDDVPERLKPALDRYLEWTAVNRPSTHRDRKTLVRALVKGIGDVTLADLSSFHVERFKKKRRDEKAAPATVNRAVAMLKHFVGLAAGWGWIDAERARALRAVKLLREPPGRVRYLTAEEREKLFAALPAHIAPLATTALLSGMRLGGITGLRRDQVDFAHRLITLTKTKSNRVRRIPMHPELVKVFEGAMRASTVEQVFVNKRGAPFRVQHVSTAFGAACGEAKIENLRFHDLRHDFATRIRRKGAGLDIVADLLGHSTLQMATRYAHLELEAMRGAVCSVE